MFGDPGVVMMFAVAPAMVAACLLAKRHIAIGAVTLAGGTAVFVVWIAVFAWLPTP